MEDTRDIISPPQQLPRGRHGLSRDEVERSQRTRMLRALADAMTRKGYVNTTVADVLQGAGVSRETFYQQFSSKHDCFMAAFDTAVETLVASLEVARAPMGDRFERFDRVLGAYLDVLTSQSARARLFLIEVYAAGPEAIEQRAAVQRRLADALAELLDVSTTEDHFRCEMVVGAVGSMVVMPLVNDDLDAVRALRKPVVDMVRRVFADST